ncbi:MAG: NAD(P)/FAD-dependent oxidoreductase [Hyphomicrobiaceae bacterium]
MKTVDVAIVGGGIVGSATAFYLARDPAFAGRCAVVIEQDPSYTRGSTGRSVGGLRQQFSTPENIAMSQVTLGIVRDPAATFGEPVDLSFREQGYLMLASEAGRAVLQETAALQRAHGADILPLDAAAVGARFPWISTDGVAAGNFGRTGEGWLDPASLRSAFRAAAIRHGAVWRHDDVVAIDASTRSLTLAGGEAISYGALVNAAGPWAGAVAALAGIPLPVEPRKRIVYVVDSREATADLHKAPLTVDPSGVWFRPEGRTFLCGVSPAIEPSIDHLEDTQPEQFETEVWPRLAARVPAFQALKLVSAWAGYYDYNTLDQNAIIGRHPDVRTFFLANGFSGHGLQQGAAAGRAVAELIVHGSFVTIDLGRLGYERVIRNEPVLERNVI